MRLSFPHPLFVWSGHVESTPRHGRTRVRINFNEFLFFPQLPELYDGATLATHSFERNALFSLVTHFFASVGTFSGSFKKIKKCVP